MKKVVTEKWIASDDKEFDNELDCEIYEDERDKAEGIETYFTLEIHEALLLNGLISKVVGDEEDFHLISINNDKDKNMLARYINITTYDKDGYKFVEHLEYGKKYVVEIGCDYIFLLGEYEKFITDYILGGLPNYKVTKVEEEKPMDNNNELTVVAIVL